MSLFKTSATEDYSKRTRVKKGYRDGRKPKIKNNHKQKWVEIVTFFIKKKIMKKINKKNNCTQYESNSDRNKTVSIVSKSSLMKLNHTWKMPYIISRNVTQAKFNYQ